MDPDSLAIRPETLLGYLSLDVAPPARWLDEREAEPEENERLASRLAEVAHELGGDADDVEVHIEGAVDAGRSWAEMDGGTHVKPAGVSLSGGAIRGPVAAGVRTDAFGVETVVRMVFRGR